MPLPQLVMDDPWLEPYAEEVQNRIDRFRSRQKLLNKTYGSLKAFASAYQCMGLHYRPDSDTWTYREWAPRARSLHLIGDFNQWNRESHPMSKDEKGIWSIELAGSELQSGSFFKVQVSGKNGVYDRIPAYVQRVKQNNETGEITAVAYREKAFAWTDKRFSAKKAKEQPVVYEAHVGMAQEHEGVGTFREFRENVLPRIKALGYNTVQLMAIKEHPYYGSFGYHVSNFFAVSSRFGTPEEFKELVNEAHRMGIAVIMDLVHSHAVRNFSEGLNEFDGEDGLYFHTGGRGYHQGWDSMLFDYGKEEVLQFLLSNIRYWMEEYHVDGFRFDGVTSLMYFHHGDFMSFDSYDKYFRDVDWDAMLYLQLANALARQVKRNVLMVAEDMSGMPGLCRKIEEGGAGFDFRLAMGIPDYWIKLLKEKKDEEWNVHDIWHVLTNRRDKEPVIAYAESHDQALVGDKTIAFRLMDKEMYWHMNKDDDNSTVERGIAMHKLIRLVTLALGGQGYLNFMGNEFGHPEWIDFPRPENGWSYKHARRQWSLADNGFLKYEWLCEFDREMLRLVRQQGFLHSPFARELNIDEKNQVLAFERGGLIFIFSFHPVQSIPDYAFYVPERGRYEILLSTDWKKFGGHERKDTQRLYETYDSDYLHLYMTNRTAYVLKKKS